MDTHALSVNFELTCLSSLHIHPLSNTNYHICLIHCLWRLRIFEYESNSTHEYSNTDLWYSFQHYRFVNGTVHFVNSTVCFLHGTLCFAGLPLHYIACILHGTVRFMDGTDHFVNGTVHFLRSTVRFVTKRYGLFSCIVWFVFEV